MLENLEWYFYAASFALIAKIYLSIISTNYTWAKNGWFALCLCLIVQNLSESILYFGVAMNWDLRFFIHPYYVSCTLLIPALYSFVIGKSITSKLLWIVSSASALCFLFTDYLIVDSHLDSTITTSKGVAFPFFLAYCLFALVTLIVHAKIVYKASDKERRVELCETLISLSPVLAVCTTICFGILVGWNVNASGYFPLATSLFIYLTLKYKCRSKFAVSVDPRTIIPMTEESTLQRKVMSNIWRDSMNLQSIDTTIDQFEKQLLKYHLRHSKSKSDMARRLGLTRQTLYRRLDKHGLK